MIGEIKDSEIQTVVIHLSANSPYLKRTQLLNPPMMAIAISVSIPLHRQPQCRLNHHSTPENRHTFLGFPRIKHCNLSASHSSSSSPSSLQSPLRTGRFLTNEELERLEFLEKYNYHQELESGFLWVRAMKEEELDMTSTLLAESFAESMMMGGGYVKLLEFLVKNYLIERKELMPHYVTLLGVYRDNGEENFQLAGTVELTFNRKGANANPPTPTPPMDSPYICNMAVRKPLRRRGIGWHLLRAGEELITKMCPSREVYLHCRIIDEAPFNMYKKTGYTIANTDSFLTLLTLQRRRHLMRKVLIVPESASVLDGPM